MPKRIHIREDASVNLLERYLDDADLTSAPALLRDFKPAGTVWLAPRVETSRYAVALLLDSRGKPRLVGKVARRPRFPARLPREFELLTRVATLFGNDPPRAPEPLALGQYDGHWLLLESAVRGVALNRSVPSRASRRTWARVDNWLFQLSIDDSAVSDTWHLKQIVEPMSLLRRVLRASGSERRLFTETETLTHSLVDAQIPAPIEHGDLFRANLFACPGNRLVAIDWELGRATGLAGADATVFLTDWLRAHRRERGQTREDSYARNFLETDGIGRVLLTEHLARSGVEPRWIDHILLATWARRTLNIVLPILSEADSERTNAREFVRTYWGSRFWQMTLARMSG
jgi:hypothetical protein